jgi:hypothetical protein
MSFMNFFMKIRLNHEIKMKSRLLNELNSEFGGAIHDVHLGALPNEDAQSRFQLRCDFRASLLACDTDCGIINIWITTRYNRWRSMGVQVLSGAPQFAV